jgi:tetratricopeptide (TPR) repeat protein
VEESILWFDKALESNSRLAFPYLIFKGDALSKLGKMTEAQKCFEAALTTAPIDIQVIGCKGEAAM